MNTYFLSFNCALYSAEDDCYVIPLHIGLGRLGCVAPQVLCGGDQTHSAPTATEPRLKVGDAAVVEVIFT